MNTPIFSSSQILASLELHGTGIPVTPMQSREQKSQVFASSSCRLSPSMAIRNAEAESPGQNVQILTAQNKPRPSVCRIQSESSVSNVLHRGSHFQIDILPPERTDLPTRSPVQSPQQIFQLPRLKKLFSSRFCSLRFRTRGERIPVIGILIF